MISILVLVGLAVVWAIVIFPDVVRWISNSRRGDTIRTFNSQLSSLGRSNAVRHDNVIDLRDRMVAPVNQGGSLRAPNRVVEPVGSPLRGTPGPVVVPGAPALRTPPPRPRQSVRQAGPDAARPVSPAVRKRRQDVLVALGAAALVTLLATIAFGPLFLYLHLLADALLIGYLVALQRAISGGSAAGERSRHNPAAPMAVRPADRDMAVRTQILEPRRIAN